VKLTDGEAARILEKGTKNLDAYLKVLQGNERKGGAVNKEATLRAMQCMSSGQNGQILLG